jgi:hypothetical protein
MVIAVHLGFESELQVGLISEAFYGYTIGPPTAP